MSRAHWPWLLLLAGCASHDAHLGRDSMVGHDWTEVQSCTPKPAALVPEKPAPGESFFVYWQHASSDRSGLSGAVPVLPFVSGDLSSSGASDCTVTARVEHGVVKSVVFSGDSGGLSGPDAECKTLVRGCLWEFTR